MMTTNREILDAMLRDPSVGAGNYIYKLQELMNEEQRSTPLIFLDQLHLDHNNNLIDCLSIDYIVNSADSYASFYKSIGIAPKDPVVLFFDESISYFLQFVALTSIGAIPVSLNSFLSTDIVAEFAMRVSARHFVSTDNRRDGLIKWFNKSDYEIKIIDLYEITPLNNSKRPPNFVHTDNDTILLAHTSGTTGIPKPVMFSHGAMFHGVRMQADKQPGHRILSILPHSHGAAMTILSSSLIRMAQVRIQTQKDPLAILREISNYQPDLVASFPKVFVDMCRLDLSEFNMHSIKYWLSTGDANHEPHIRKLISTGHHTKNGEIKGGSVFIDNLGSSEFAFAMFRNVHTKYTNNYDRCIGVPFDWVEAEVLSEEGEIMPINQVGYLGVISGSVTKGYWNNNYLTEKNTLRGYWLTGDLVYKNECGIYFHVDRVSDKIETDAGTLYSCQCEELILKSFVDIFEVSVVGLDADGKIDVVAFVEWNPSCNRFNRDDIKSGINAIFTEKGWPLISRVEEQEAGVITGVTGKKLKKKMREGFFQTVA